jgi:Glycosyltransferase family 17
MARRWHPFMFYNELDWLECKLWETYEQMHRYILVEATVDHRGNEKPLYYADNKARFAQWADKIEHVIVRTLPTLAQTDQHWVRERMQRDAAMFCLAEHAAPEDLIINMDADEIPSQVTMTAEPDGIVGLRLANHLFAVDWFAEMNVMGSMLPMRCLNTSMQSSDLPGAVVGGLSWIRENRYIFPFIDNAGWHFSWVGGPEAYRIKDLRCCHIEHHDERMAPGEVERIYGQVNGTLVEIGENMPRYIRERACPPEWFGDYWLEHR